MGLTVAALITGIVVMLKGGKANEKFSARLMGARVLFQAITIVIIGFLLYMTN